MSSRIVLITGANSGVGYATTKVLTRASATFHVIMTGRSLQKLETAKSQLEAEDFGKQGSISLLLLDVTNRKSIEAAVKDVKDKFGRLDVLINNAAVGSMDPDVETRMRLSMETNVIGPAMVAEAFRPLLLRSQTPYSIYVSSGAGSLTKAGEPKPPGPFKLPNENAYRASKAALNMLAVVELNEYGPMGLKVFTMCPGFVVSNLRGPSEEARTGWGHAQDAETSGQILLSIIEGKRDADTGKFVHKDGIYPW